MRLDMEHIPMSHYIYMHSYKQRIPMKNSSHFDTDTLNCQHEGRGHRHGDRHGRGMHRGDSEHGSQEPGQHGHGGRHRVMKMAQFGQRAYERGFQAGFDAALSRHNA